MIEDTGWHPQRRRVAVCAGDQIDVVLAGPRGREHGVATPNWKRDHLGPVVGQLARDFWEEAVVANHHAELAKPRVKHWIFVPRLDTAHPLASPQANLEILA